VAASSGAARVREVLSSSKDYVFKSPFNPRSPALDSAGASDWFCSIHVVLASNVQHLSLLLARTGTPIADRDKVAGRRKEPRWL
jgi:hypothetical protein